MRHRTGRRRRQRGMGLIEVMVALGVLTVAGIGTIALMLQLFNINRQAAKRTVSAEMARSMIDDMLGAGYVTYGRDTFFTALDSPPSPLASMSCAPDISLAVGSGTVATDTLRADCTDQVNGIARRIVVMETPSGTVRVMASLGWKIRPAANDRFWTQYDVEIVIP